MSGVNVDQRSSGNAGILPYEEYILREYSIPLMNILRKTTPDARHHRLTINLLDMMSTRPKMARCIFKDPSGQTALIEQALQNVQKTLLVEIGSLSSFRNINARLAGIPLHRSIYFRQVPGAEVLGKLVAIKGTVVRVGAMKMMDLQMSFQCNKCGSPATSKPDNHQYGAIPNPPYCTAIIDGQRCTSIKFNKVQQNGITPKEDYQEIRIQEITGLLTVGSVPRSINVVLKQDLVDSCKAGDELVVIGWIINRGRSVRSGQRMDMEFCLIANNILRQDNRAEKGEGDDSNIAESSFVQKFWTLHGSMDKLKGRNKIVSSFCSQIYGLFLVKLGVLLTIIGGYHDVGTEALNASSRRGRREGHILLVGDPGTAKSQFLVAAAKLASRSVLTNGSGSSNAGLTAAAVKEAGTGSWQLEAGALVLADGGVCCIDEFSALRGHDRTAIHEAMEQQTLSVAKAGLVCKLPTRCSIIAACNSKGDFEDGMAISATVALASPLLSRFDLILVIMDKRSIEWDRELSSSILNASMKSKRQKTSNQLAEADLLDFEQLRSYVTFIRSQINPKMSSAACTILSKYYQAQRGSDLRDAARTTIRLLESLVRLAQAHAKLMGNYTVELADAIWAVILMESSLATQSILLKRPDLHADKPDDPRQWYEEMEGEILGKLQVNKRVLFQEKADENVDTAIGYDDEEVEKVMCSWFATQNS